MAQPNWRWSQESKCVWVKFYLFSFSPFCASRGTWLVWEWIRLLIFSNKVIKKHLLGWNWSDLIGLDHTWSDLTPGAVSLCSQHTQTQIHNIRWWSTIERWLIHTFISFFTCLKEAPHEQALFPVISNSQGNLQWQTPFFSYCVLQPTKRHGQMLQITSYDFIAWNIRW